MKDIITLFLYLVNYYFTQYLKQLKESPNHDCSSCSICLDEINHDHVTTFECNHKFHLSCLNQWVNKSATCPVCRTSLQVIKTIRVINGKGCELLHS